MFALHDGEHRDVERTSQDISRFDHLYLNIAVVRYPRKATCSVLSSRRRLYIHELVGELSGALRSCDWERRVMARVVIQTQRTKTRREDASVLSTWVYKIQVCMLDAESHVHSRKTMERQHSR